MTLGVRGLVRDERGQVLLVRHSYTPGWHLPGGVAPDEPPHLHGVFVNPRFPGDHVALFVVGRWHAVPSDHGYEILAAQFHATDALPQGTTDGTRRRVAEVCDGAPVSEVWSDKNE